MTIQDEKERVDLNAYFKETFASKATSHEFTAEDCEFRLRGLRLYNPHDMQHRLLYAADFREVLAGEA